MKKIIKNYKSTLILILSIILGVLIGLIFKEKANVLKPLGDIFINLLLVIIVPLIFLSISVSISKMSTPKRLGKIMITTIIIFIITSLVAVIVGLLSTYKINLINIDNITEINSSLNQNEVLNNDNVNFLERTKDLLTVKNFSDLFSTDNLIALFVFSTIFGLALNLSKEKANEVKKVLSSLNDVTMKMVEIIMYYAPVGLGCYTASLVGTFGKTVAIGYLKTFIIYLVVSVLFYFIVYTLYAYISYGKKGVKLFWKNIVAPSVNAIATCSSAASIPSNILASKNIGVSDDIAETVIPLGTSFHKDGSIIGSVFKIMFLVNLFGFDITSEGMILKVLLTSLLVTLLVTAVPIGGGTISEMMIITLMGFNVSSLPILTIIATIIDAPATMLNVVGDLSSSMLVSRIVDGKSLLTKKET